MTSVSASGVALHPLALKEAPVNAWSARGVMTRERRALKEAMQLRMDGPRDSLLLSALA